MMNYHIDYLWDGKDSEVRYTITDDSGAHVYDESVIGEFDSIAELDDYIMDYTDTDMDMHEIAHEIADDITAKQDNHALLQLMKEEVIYSREIVEYPQSDRQELSHVVIMAISTELYGFLYDVAIDRIVKLKNKQ